jgi:hypothetical protein
VLLQIFDFQNTLFELLLERFHRASRLVSVKDANDSRACPAHMISNASMTSMRMLAAQLRLRPWSVHG